MFHMLMVMLCIVSRDSSAYIQNLVSDFEVFYIFVNCLEVSGKIDAIFYNC